MSHKNTDFPQYRKLANEKVFYRLRSDRDFDEIQRVGSKAMWFSMHATQYPEFLRIGELLSLHGEGVLESSEAEFVAVAEQFGLSARL